MKHLFAIIAIAAITLVPIHSYSQCHVDDVKALQDLFNNTNGGSWTDSSGWYQVLNPGANCDLSTVSGVILNANGRVRSINLSSNKLTGVLLPTLDLLSELQNLNLSGNSISGAIPSTLGNIKTLEILQLQVNDLGASSGFTGSIPITTGSFPSLRIIRLNRNKLTGGIPADIGSLSTLEEISFNNNTLGGTLPHTIGNLGSLQTLKLFNNGLVGCIPSNYINLDVQGAFVNIDPDNNLDAHWADFIASGAGGCMPFITTWSTNNPGTSCPSCISIPTVGTGYNYDVDLTNDGTFDLFGMTSDFNFSYGVEGTYQIAIRGDFPRIHFNGEGDDKKIVSVDQWGDTKWISMEDAFHGCENLQVLATDAPNLTNVLNLSGMFRNATILNADFSHWDVSNVTDVSQMFWQALEFNSPLIWGDKTSNITDMTSMFFSATNFNQDLSNWIVTAVTSMRELFLSAKAFNQNLSSWDVSSVTDMSLMFQEADDFNSPLDWGDKTGAVIEMTQMFGLNDTFNQDISDWDVSEVTNMRGMFILTEEFNQNLSSWDVSSVTDMSFMFQQADAFNSPLDWNVENVTNISSMFNGAEAFNQDLSDWIITSVTDMDEVFDNSAMTISNYDKTLISWADQDPPENVIWGEGLFYCSSGTAHDDLMTNYNWTFSDSQDPGGTNEFTSTSGPWIDGSNWSLMKVPSFCNDVIIDGVTSGDVEITIDNIGQGATLNVKVGSALKVNVGAELEIRSIP